MHQNLKILLPSLLKTVLYIFGFIQRKELPQRIIAFFCEPPDKSPLYSLSMHIEKKHKNINHPFFGRSFHVGDLLLAHEIILLFLFIMVYVVVEILIGHCLMLKVRYYLK